MSPGEVVGRTPASRRVPVSRRSATPPAGSWRTCGTGATRPSLEYTERFDGVRPERDPGPREEIDRAARVPALRAQRESFLAAFENVRAFHEREMDRSWELSRAGATVGQRVRPLRRAGVYVPGGHAAYPSTLIMAAVPARVAGVGEICVCTPPGPDGGCPMPRARRRGPARARRGLRRRRSAGGGRDGLRHGEHRRP